MDQNNSPTEYTLITGASGGIGEAFALEFARHGHNLILTARRQDKLQTIADRLTDRYSIEVTVIETDLAEPDGPVKLYQAVSALKHNVGILVNNSGILAEGKFLDTDINLHNQIFDINARALMQLTHLFGQDMRKRKSGRILNVCSTSAFQPVPNLATYAASKALVLSLSEALAIENEEFGITVTALCPGFVETGMTLKNDGKHMNLPLVKLLTAGEVAAQGYQATMQGTPVYINGIGNRIMQQISQHQPRWIKHSIGKLLQQNKF